MWLTKLGKLLNMMAKNGALTGRPVAINPVCIMPGRKFSLLAAIHPGRPAYNISKTRWSITMVSIGKRAGLVLAIFREKLRFGHRHLMRGPMHLGVLG